MQLNIIVLCKNSVCALGKKHYALVHVSAKCHRRKKPICNINALTRFTCISSVGWIKVTPTKSLV